MAVTLVSTVTVGSGGASTIQWTGFAGTGKDLLVVLSGRNSVNETGVRLRFNSDSGNNYAYRMLYGNGTAGNNSENASSQSGIIAYTLNIPSHTANTFGSTQFYVENYTSADTKNVTIDGVEENNASYGLQTIVAGNWTGTSAITTVQLIAQGTSAVFVQHSTASLYIIS
jgi:hypothetical protein